MVRFSFAACLLLAACSSSSEEGANPGAGGGSCPDVSGTWKVTQHCDASLVGLSLVASEKDCVLSFAAPFDAFMGSVTADGHISLSGPQTCSGSASASAISMVCTPGTCNVALTR